MIAAMHKPPFRRRLLFCGIALLLCWAAAEIVLGVTGWHRAPSERVYKDIYSVVHELKPHVSLPFSNADVPNDPTNHAGFRGPEFTDDKPADVYRIIAVGDSTTFGVKTAESDTYARRLETTLREATKQPIEVLNAGIPGTNIYAHRLLIADKLIRYRPDLLIVYVLFNSRPEIEAFRRLEHKAARNEDVPVAIAHRILRRSRVYRLLRKAIKGGESREIESHFDAILRHLQQSNKEENRWVEVGFREDLEGIVGLSRRHGFHLLMVNSVHRALVDDKLQLRQDPSLTPSGLVVSSDHYRNFLQSICRENDIVFLDPTDAFLEATAAGENLFADPVHFNESGHHLMSEIIFATVKQHAGKFEISKLSDN